MPDMLDGLGLSELIIPIDGAAGEDLSFSNLFDQIKEARRADPHYLAQGEWQTDLKTSDWELVTTLATQGLAQRSKDLMLAAWLGEALAHMHHFPGIALGLELIQQLLDRFWPSLFPSLEEGLEERAARLAWLNTTLAQVVSELPITQGQAFSLLRYEESRLVENLALQNPQTMQAALGEGKINAEIFQRSVALTDSAHLQLKAAEISTCQNACEQLQNCVDTLFGSEAPRFSALAHSLQRTSHLVERLLKERGLDPTLAAVSRVDAQESAPDPAKGQTEAEARPSLRSIPTNREEAFTLLENAAQYFKHAEPHSPVPYLIERAIKWGNMPLEGWLQEVIKDNGVVENIRELLGTRQG
ncbi:type VI secretion system protein TssA [Pseudomonas japonica]|uniref:type VI secretion system protein TssA n=1 Tax=Pseudomonas japonica TaxID=256466 RepID=UPI0015E3F493|nr:type VI secretion system protein TssA [Pseudomonas japonica]MBA1245063.1 type VI secretion system protein TssA [Pseudomonas japonica]